MFRLCAVGVKYPALSHSAPFLRLSGRRSTWQNDNTAAGVLLIVAFALVAPAAAVAQRPDERLAKVVQPGDTVTMTPTSGLRRQGVVVDLRPDAMVLRKGDTHVIIPLTTVKTVRLHRAPRAEPHGQGDVRHRETCNEVSCAIGVLVCVGIGAAAEGIDELAHPAKVVYRRSPRAQ